jgi:ssDNA-binding replication factor A large subunit
MDAYDSLIERIAHASKLEVSEIERKVEAKRAKLSGLVSKEGAAQIVAAEMGINFEKERLKISEISQGMRKANVLGKIVQLYPVRSYNKNGKEGKVGRLLIADESSNVIVVLWDTNHIGLIEGGKIKEGDVIEISNAMVRNNELHLSSFGDIKVSKEVLNSVMVQKSATNKKLNEAVPGDRIKTRAFIVQTFEPRYFEVCPECSKKVVDDQCAIHGKVESKKRAILSIVLDDGAGSLRGVIFGENIKSLGLSDDEIFNLEKFIEKKDVILGEEKIFSGNVKSNALYNTTELNIDSIEDVNIESLIAELESANK